MTRLTIDRGLVRGNGEKMGPCRAGGYFSVFRASMHRSDVGLCAKLGVHPVAHICDGNLVYPPQARTRGFERPFLFSLSPTSIEDVTHFKTILNGPKGHSCNVLRSKRSGPGHRHPLPACHNCRQWRHRCSAATGGMRGRTSLSYKTSSKSTTSRISHGNY